MPILKIKEMSTLNEQHNQSRKQTTLKALAQSHASLISDYLLEIESLKQQNFSTTRRLAEARIKSVTTLVYQFEIERTLINLLKELISTHECVMDGLNREQHLLNEQNQNNGKREASSKHSASSNVATT